VKLSAPKPYKTIYYHFPWRYLLEIGEWDIELRKAISHPINRKIIELLADKNLSFTELLTRINCSYDHGNFSYHMKRLTGFIEFDPTTKKYELTYRGRLLLDIIREFRSRVRKGNQPPFYVAQLKQGDHAFALFSSESFKQDIVFSFVRAGLRKGNAVVSVVGEEKLDSEVLALQKRGIDMDSLPQGALSMIPSFDWYIKEGKAESKTIIANWQRLLEEKKKAGFAGLQATAEMETFFDSGKTEELLQFEESLGRQIGLGLCGLCIYDNKRIAEMGISKIFKSHSHIISEEMWGKTILKEEAKVLMSKIGFVF
jgi:DNA-binding transcriptional ArsR family regulator